MLILDLLGILYHAVVVFTSGYDFLFKSTLWHCASTLVKKYEMLKAYRLKWGHTLDSNCTFSHFYSPFGMQLSPIPLHINQLHAIFHYIAIIQYANSVNALLQYANSAIATFPLCPNSNMIVFLLLQNRGAGIRTFIMTS